MTGDILLRKQLRSTDSPNTYNSINSNNYSHTAQQNNSFQNILTYVFDFMFIKI